MRNVTPSDSHIFDIRPNAGAAHRDGFILKFEGIAVLVSVNFPQDQDLTENGFGLVIVVLLAIDQTSRQQTFRLGDV